MPELWTLALMKAIIIGLVVVCLASFGWCAGAKPSSDEVIVKVLAVTMPHDTDKRERFLWDHFANKPEADKFQSYETEGWENNFAKFSESLVRKAETQKLDSASLRKSLGLVLKDSADKIAYLPVGAYQTTLDGKPVWIIVVVWEYAYSPERGKFGLGHIRMFAFDQKTFQRVGYCTCK